MKGPERDYSGRSLFEKLGVTSQAHVALVGAHDDAFVLGLNEGLAKAASQARLRTRYDIIFLRVDAPGTSRASRRRAFSSERFALDLSSEGSRRVADRRRSARGRHRGRARQQ